MLQNNLNYGWGRTGGRHTLQVKQTVLSAPKTGSTMVGAQGAPHL